MEFMMDYQKIRHALDIVGSVTAVKGPVGTILPVAQWQFKDGMCMVMACNAYSAARCLFSVPDMPADFACELFLDNFSAPKTREGQVLVSVDDGGLCIHLSGMDVAAKLHPEDARFRKTVDVWQKADNTEPQAVVRYNRQLLLMMLKSIKPQSGKRTLDEVEFRVNLDGDYGPTIIKAGNEERFILPLRK